MADNLHLVPRNVEFMEAVRFTLQARGANGGGLRNNALPSLIRSKDGQMRSVKVAAKHKIHLAPPDQLDSIRSGSGSTTARPCPSGAGSG